jgi:hypothetical protein
MNTRENEIWSRIRMNERGWGWGWGEAKTNQTTTTKWKD